MRQQVERRTQHHHDRNVEAEVETTEHAPTLNILRHEMAEILDEIDEVLEENAEEFVKRHAQKGREEPELP